MRDLLVNTVGFDEVYVAENDIVSRDLIEQYVKGIIARKMSKNDRLLFYYSGHGGDNQGKTGYMLFGRARSGEFWGGQVLAIDALSDWSRELQVQHILFIVDSCASGLAFTAKMGPDTTDKLLLQTLSGNGSRTVLTAGTADEATYALEDRLHLGNGVFTRSLLDAFRSRRISGMPLVTVNDLFSSIEKYMAEFRATQGKATTPRMWSLQEGDYRGTFVFLNTKAGAVRLTGEQARALGITSVAKSEDERLGETPTGIIEISSGANGNLSIDGKDMGWMYSGETRRFLQQTTGRRQLQFKEVPGSTRIFKPPEDKEVTVEGGKIAYAAFGLKSPIDATGNRPVGTVVLQSIHELSGEAFIDGFSVGQVQKNGQLTVANVTAGPHTWRLGDAIQGASGPILITPNETTYTVLGMPAPPTGVTAIVQ